MEKMTLKDLVKAVSAATGQTQTATEATLRSATEVIRHEVMVNGNSFNLRGFGVFSARDYPERMSKNPRTGEPAIAPAMRKMRFKAGKGA